MADVENQPIIPVPKHLKDSHYAAAKKAGFGVDYKYPHNFRDGFVSQEYIPAEMKKKYYVPKDIGYEKNIQNYLQKLQSLIENGLPPRLASRDSEAGKPSRNNAVKKDK
jgi:putative ATPase